jgi:hypothetical protein
MGDHLVFGHKYVRFFNVSGYRVSVYRMLTVVYPLVKFCKVLTEIRTKVRAFRLYEILNETHIK